MEWDAAYSVGLAEIDAQHKELISLFSRIADVVDDHEASWSDIHFKIVELRNFAVFHFEFEEALMRLFGYPEDDCEGHARAHASFFERMDAIERTSLQNNLKQEIVRFLFDWLTQHITKTDTDYAKYILAGASVVRV